VSDFNVTPVWLHSRCINLAAEDWLAELWSGGQFIFNDFYFLGHSASYHQQEGKVYHPR